MKDKIRIFLDTDLLEKYLIGSTSKEETLQVERYIALYPEVRKSYDELQSNLQAYANLYALKTPEGLKDRILYKIKAQNTGKRKFRRYAIAASITAFMFAGSSYFFFFLNQSLQDENVLVNSKIKTL